MRQEPRIIFILGAPAVGKTTLAVALAQKLGYKHLETGSAVKHLESYVCDQDFACGSFYRPVLDKVAWMTCMERMLRGLRQGHSYVFSTSGANKRYKYLKRVLRHYSKFEIKLVLTDAQQLKRYEKKYSRDNLDRDEWLLNICKKVQADVTIRGGISRKAVLGTALRLVKMWRGI